MERCLQPHYGGPRCASCLRGSASAAPVNSRGMARVMLVDALMMQVLVKTDVTKYLEFKAVDGSFVLNREKVHNSILELKLDADRTLALATIYPSRNSGAPVTIVETSSTSGNARFRRSC